MSTLDDCRQQIDAIDAQITALFEERMRVVESVARYKQAHNLPVLQPDRERAVLDRAASRLQNPAYAPGVRALYETLMSVSRQSQHDALDNPSAQLPASTWTANPAVAYPGAEGSFSEQAALSYFGADANRVAFPAFALVAQALADNSVDYAVFPIENSTAGSIDETYRLLLKHNLSIVGEQFVPIRHHLLAAPGASLASVREVRSHPQAIAQCHAFLSEHPDWRIVPSLNTAISAQAVAQANNPALAAIASLQAAKRYGLSILCKDIHEARANCTRFAIVAHAPIEDADADKASLYFTLDNEVGALSRIVSAFARQGINLCRLESRPMPDTPWTYAFYADIAWHTQRRALLLALEEAGRDARVLKLLGLYRKGKEGSPCASD